MKELDFSKYNKYLDKLEQFLGKRNNFTIDDAVKYFVEACNAKVYFSAREMLADGKFHWVDVDLDDITTFTDFDENTDKYVCFIISSEKWGGVDYVWVIYNDNKEIIDFFSEIGYEESAVLFVMCKNWKEDLIERHKQWEEYDKAHPLEERLKALLGEDYDKKNPWDI